MQVQMRLVRSFSTSLRPALRAAKPVPGLADVVADRTRDWYRLGMFLLAGGPGVATALDACQVR
jgi:hypothetical protein